MSQQINLFNPIFLAQRKHFSAKTMAIALGIIATAMGLVAIAELVQIGTLSADRLQTAAQRKTVEAQLAQLTAQSKARTPSPLLQDEISRLEAQAKTQAELATTLQGAQLGSTQGYSRYLRALAKQAVEGVWLTRFTLTGPGDRLSLEGRVLRDELLPDYLRRLSTDDVLRGRSFSELQMNKVEVKPGAGAAADPVKYVSFRLAAELAPSK